MHGQQGNDLNAGKNLIFQGANGQINLKDSVSQGAGSLTFRDNYTVTTSNGSTWTGGGIIVDKDASVTWQVNGEKGDNLHKIGEGTLIVQGTGVNEGGLKVGDRKVVLNQQADNKGQVQAFMVCLRSMPNVFTGSCARMRCCLSEKPLYRHRNGHILAKWP
ncbi:immunoglobulin A1 protease family protein [Escherichia coli P0304816.1]|nr:immunoglobulin A1 protease family protein [Escherichia coli MP021552.8]EMZ99735.1 immunoglobulin A1 protease family protein [Escherichia coli P0304816.1]